MQQNNLGNQVRVSCENHVSSSGNSAPAWGRWISVFLLIFAVIAMAACGEKRRGYRAANTYEGCMAQCDDANECGNVLPDCSLACYFYLVENMGYYQFTKAQKECMQGTGQYLACVGSACTLDEHGDPYYSEEAMEECEPIMDQYETVCEQADRDWDDYD